MWGLKHLSLKAVDIENVYLCDGKCHTPGTYANIGQGQCFFYFKSLQP